MGLDYWFNTFLSERDEKVTALITIVLAVAVVAFTHTQLGAVLAEIGIAIFVMPLFASDIQGEWHYWGGGLVLAVLLYDQWSAVLRLIPT